MCIRDSFSVAPGEVVMLENCRLNVGEKKNKPELAAKLGNCLLYTSDAADERSSVDLGGRRIIKKKKKKASSIRSVDNTTNSTLDISCQMMWREQVRQKKTMK